MNRPDVTSAQKIAGAAAGVPIVVSLLAAFGVFVPSPAEQHALTEATKWATGFALVLIAGDSHLRGKRNEADAARGHAARTDAATQTLDQAARRIEQVSNATTASPSREVKGGFGTLEPDLREPSEIDLADPALDDPDFDAGAGAGSGVSTENLEAHYGNAATARDVAERDARGQ